MRYKQIATAEEPLQDGRWSNVLKPPPKKQTNKQPNSGWTRWQKVEHLKKKKKSIICKHREIPE